MCRKWGYLSKCTNMASVKTGLIPLKMLLISCLPFLGIVEKQKLSYCLIFHYAAKAIEKMLTFPIQPYNINKHLVRASLTAEYIARVYVWWGGEANLESQDIVIFSFL